MHPRFISRFLPPVRLAGLLIALAVAPMGARAAAPTPDSDAPAAAKSKPTKAQMQRGRKVFQRICFACHQVNGKGIPGVYPPLAHSDFLREHRTRIIDALLHGLKGPVIVRKKKFNSVMPELPLTNRQIADVLTYVSNSWGNDYGTVTEKMVAKQRQKVAHNSSSGKQRGEQEAAAAGNSAAGGMMHQPMMGGSGGKGGMMMGGGMMSGGGNDRNSGR